MTRGETSWGRNVLLPFGIYMIIHGKISRCIFSKSVSVGRNISLVPVECRAAVTCKSLMVILSDLQLPFYNNFFDSE